jgi:hypothetical protein
MYSAANLQVGSTSTCSLAGRVDRVGYVLYVPVPLCHWLAPTRALINYPPPQRQTKSKFGVERGFSGGISPPPFVLSVVLKMVSEKLENTLSQGYLVFIFTTLDCVLGVHATAWADRYSNHMQNSRKIRRRLKHENSCEKWNTNEHNKTGFYPHTKAKCLTKYI